MTIRERPDDDIRERDDLSTISLKPTTGEVTPATPFDTIREMQDEENIFRLQSSDFEQGRQDDQRQRQVNRLVQQLQQQYVKDMANDPENMTLEGAQEFFKQNPARDMAEEAQRSAILDRKKGEIGKMKQAYYANVSKAPKTLQQTVREVMYRLGQDTGIVQTEEEKMAHDMNVRSLAKFYNLPEKVISKNYSELTAAYRDQPEKFTDVLQVALIPPLVAGIVMHPLAAGLGLLEFQALSEVENAVVSGIKNEKYRFLSGRNVSDLLPEEASSGSKDMIDLLSFIGKAGVLYGVKKVSPEIWARLTKDVVNTQGLPKKMYFDASKLQSMSEAEFRTTFSKDLGLSGQNIRDIFLAKRSGKGVSIEVAAETISSKLVDKPYWASIKKFFNIKPFEQSLRVKPSGSSASVTEEAQGLPSPETVGKNIINRELTKVNKSRTISNAEMEAQRFVTEQYPKAYENFVEQSKKEFSGYPRVVSADIGKFAIPGMKAEYSADYHEAGSALSKARTEDILADPATQDLPGLMMAGGAGAGKSSTLRITGGSGFLDDHAIVFDVNANEVGSAAKKINQVLGSGRKMEVVYVYRDPIESWVNGVLPRIAKQNRLVPIESFLETHFGAQDSIPALRRMYEDDPRVSFKAYINNPGKGNIKAAELDNLPRIRYTKDELRNILVEETNNALRKGIITESQYKGLIGDTAAGKEVIPDAGRIYKSGSGDQRFAGLSPQEQYTATRLEPELAGVTEPKKSYSKKGLSFAGEFGKSKLLEMGFDDIATGFGSTANVVNKDGKPAIAYSFADDGLDGFAIHPKFQNTGLAQQALKDLAINGHLMVMAPNADMLRLMRSVGSVDYNKQTQLALLEIPQVGVPPMEQGDPISEIKEGGSFYYTTPMQQGPGIKEVKVGSRGEVQNSPLKLKFKRQGYVSFPNEEIKSPADVAVTFKELKNEAVERFYVIAMKGDTPVAVEPIAIGNIYSAPASAFEIMPVLFAKGADSCYLVHNHPTGDPKPSPQDLALSSAVKHSLVKHNIEFKGHVIINDTHYGLIDDYGETAVLEGYTTTLETGPKKVPVYTKYVEWLQSKTNLQQIKKADDVFNLVKGMNVDKERNAAVFYMNYQNRVVGVEMIPNARNMDVAVAVSALGRKIEKGATLLRAVNVIIANAKLSNPGVLYKALDSSGIHLLDSIELVPGSDGSLNVYTSASDQGKLGEGIPEYAPGQGKEVVPEEPAAQEQTVEQWKQKKEELRLSLEGSRAGLSDAENIRTHFLGRITKYDKGWMKEEMSVLPLVYRKEKGGIKPDEALDELRNTFGVELADEQAMAEFFKSLEGSRKEYLTQIAAQEQELKELSANPPGKERKFIKTVRESDKTPEEVAAKVQSFYDPITNAETLAEAQDFVNKDYSAALEKVMGPSRADTLTNAIGIVLLNKANTEGRIGDAIAIAERYAEKQTELGQAIQALSMYNRLTPEGILQLATRTIKRAQDAVPQRERITNFEKMAKELKTPEERDALAKRLKIPHLSEEIAKQLLDMAKEIQAMPDGREKDIQTALMLKKISDLIPRNLLSKISMAQTLAQLLNPKTAIRNILGNLGFLAVENLSDYIAAGLDMAASVFTGKRTVWTPAFYDQIKGGLQGGKEGLEEALMGIDLREMGRQFDLPKNGVFDSKVMQGFEKLLNITLKVPDRAFYQAAFNQSIARQTRAAGLEEPTAEMIERAHMLGLYRTFQDDNAISRLFVNLKRTLNLRKGWGLGDMVLKYPKTPGNLLARGIEYSPFGLIKSLWILGKAALKYPFEQEEFSRSTSRSILGSALLVGVGAFLAGLGIISGKREKDKDAAAMKAQAGIREYQINTSALKRYIMSGMDPESVSLRYDDTLANYDWFQPSSLGLALGANMVLAGDKSIVDQTINMGERLLEAVNTLEAQPLLQGLRVMADKQSFGEGLSETIQGIPASFVPTLFNQIRQLTDNTARNTKDPNYFAEMYNRVKLRVPGVSKSLPEQIDTLGKTREMYQAGSNNPFNVFLNPAFVSKYKPDPVAEMVLDIWQSSGETIHFPRVASGKIKLGSQTKEPVELTPSQYMEFQKYIGKKTDVLFSILAANEKFRAAPAEYQAKKLQGYLTDIYTAGKIEVLGHRPKRVPKDVIAVIKAIGINKKEIENNELRELSDTETIRERPEAAPIRERPAQ